MPKIRNIFSAAVEIPLARPVSWSNVSVSTREYILCWVVDDEGNFGFGYGLGSRFPRGACLMHQAIQENLKHLVVGQDPFMNEAIWNAMYTESLLLGRQGVIMRAISCIDIAIWDLKAKIVGLPLYKLLGGSVSEVPAYASGGYYQDGKDVPGLVREIQFYRSRGFTSFKIKVGQMTPELEEERVAAALDAAEPHGKVAIDANNAWKSVAEAWPYVRRFEKFNLWWLEEPFSPDNPDATRFVITSNTVRSRSCRPMPRLLAASRNGDALPRWQRAGIFQWHLTGSRMCTPTCWQRYPMDGPQSTFCPRRVF
jgi:D-arabinonate dehydratase